MVESSIRRGGSDKQNDADADGDKNKAPSKNLNSIEGTLSTEI